MYCLFMCTHASEDYYCGFNTNLPLLYLSAVYDWSIYYKGIHCIVHNVYSMCVCVCVSEFRITYCVPCSYGNYLLCTGTTQIDRMRFYNLVFFSACIMLMLTIHIVHCILLYFVVSANYVCTCTVHVLGMLSLFEISLCLCL